MDSRKRTESPCSPGSSPLLAPEQNPLSSPSIFLLEANMNVTSREGVTEWHPARIVESTPTKSAHNDTKSSPEATDPSFSLILLNQPFNTAVFQRVWTNAYSVIAADGGANRLYDLHRNHVFGKDLSKLSAIIGDLDSLKPEIARIYGSVPYSTRIIKDPDQDTTDFTKAINYVRNNAKDSPASSNQSHPEKPPARDIVALGGLGGRVDQAMSMLHHLLMFQKTENYSEGRVYLVSPEAITFVLKRGNHLIRVGPLPEQASDPVTPQRETKRRRLEVTAVPTDSRQHAEEQKREWPLGKHVGIMPIGGKATISTRGLQWDVTDWETEMGGQISTSNLVKEPVVYVKTSADVLFTIDFSFEGAGDEVGGSGRLKGEDEEKEVKEEDEEKKVKKEDGEDEGEEDDGEDDEESGEDEEDEDDDDGEEENDDDYVERMRYKAWRHRNQGGHDSDSSSVDLDF